MAESKTESLVNKEINYRIKILAPSSTKNWQRKKILFKQIKNQASKRFKRYNFDYIVVNPYFNEYIGKYNKFKIPKYFDINAKIIEEDKIRIQLDCKR